MVGFDASGDVRESWRIEENGDRKGERGERGWRIGGRKSALIREPYIIQSVEGSTQRTT